MTAPPGEPGSGGVNRKRFLDWLLGTTLGGMFIAISYPVAEYLDPPESGESAVNSVVLSVKPSDVPLNSGQIFRFGNKPGILIRTPQGELRAFTAICTHLGCIVQYGSEHSDIWCACHNGHYDLNGKNVSGPPPRPLAPYIVKVQGNEIVVSKQA